jgi:hypothetical protein
MDYKVLEKLLQKENIEPKKIWAVFGANTEKEMEQVIVDNLKSIKINPDDGLIYLSPDIIYKASFDQDQNIYYEKLMVISFFLKGFASYDDIIGEAFTKALGMVKYVYIADQALKDNPYYVFFKEAYSEYKRDKYFRDQTDRMLEVFDEIAKQAETIDLTETKELLEEFNNSKK